MLLNRPGPAINTIGKFNGKPIITISGHENFPATSGSLDLTTVHLTGGLPDSQINFFDALHVLAHAVAHRLPGRAHLRPGHQPGNSQQ